MTAWAALSTEEQEAIMGRTKLDNIEIDDDDKPRKSHKSLATIEDGEGGELAILRDNMPFGRPGAGEFGTYFIGYSGRLWVIERMLERMFVGAPPGSYDRLLDFSTAVTGTTFFVPTAGMLDGAHRAARRTCRATQAPATGRSASARCATRPDKAYAVARAPADVRPGCDDRRHQGLDPRRHRRHAARPAQPPRGRAHPQLVAKVESLNPGGSIKDRVAVALIEAAERDGHLRPAGRSSSRRRATRARGSRSPPG